MIRPPNQDGLLGIFPSFSEPGGIQLSGRLAWEGLCDPQSIGVDNGHFHTWNPYLFSYEPTEVKSKGPQSASTIVVSSKPEALFSALRFRMPTKVILIWHLALLKLLPLIARKNQQIALFLHGIEAWKHHDWLTRRLLRKVDLFISNSDYTWERFVKNNPEYENSNHVTVHLGLSSSLGSETILPENTPSALMVGRLNANEDYKGHKEVIGAWKLVARELPDAELWIVGDGDLKSELQSLAIKNGLQKQIRFWGWVSEAEKEQLLNRCQFLALPSRGEGFGLVYLEAMRQGRPCLVSTADAGREVINPPEAGLAVDVDSVEELKSAICSLLKPGHEWSERSRNARARYESQFTAKHFQNRLITAISSLR